MPYTATIAPRAAAAPPACWSAIADALATQGWAQQECFLPDSLWRALADECRSLSVDGSLKQAGVGRGAAQSLQPAVRGDQIRWLAAGQSEACDQYLQLMEALRQALNRDLFLGLEEYESHFARYRPGAAYQKHLDRFRDDDHRTVSAVIYLNEEWLDGQGGALRLHPEQGEARDVAPVGGRLVLFLSAEMPHEVLPATRERLSLAGWFRRR